MPTFTLAPSTGPISGGNTVVISGSGLSTTTSVEFGTTPAVFTILSDSEVTAVAPAGTGTVVVTITTPAGTSSASPPYTYRPAPTLASISPSSGPSSGGNTVTLTGTELTGATVVQFGGAPASSFTVISDTTIQAVAPAGTGTVPVTVVSPGGTSNAVIYAFFAAEGKAPWWVHVLGVILEAIGKWLQSL